MPRATRLATIVLSFALAAFPLAAEKPVVAVSIPPQAYFVERIAGGRVATLTIVGPGQSPHSYEPSPRQMAELAKARVWFTIGVDFEKALKPRITATLPGLLLADAARGVVYRTLEAHEDGEEGQGRENGRHDDDEEDGGPDPHVWLGRQAAKIQAAIVRDELSLVDPAGKAVFAANHDALVRDVDAVFDRLARDLAPLRGKPVFVYHPAFGYFLDEFGILQVAVETGGKEPTQKGIAELAARAKREGARTIFVQKQFPARAAAVLAKSLGGAVAPLDPLAGDWLANLERMGDALRKAAR